MWYEGRLPGATSDMAPACHPATAGLQPSPQDQELATAAARRSGPPAHPSSARTLRMSATARVVPRTVPVTFERPTRGW